MSETETPVASHIAKVGKDGRRITAKGLETLRANSAIGRDAARKTFAAGRQALATHESGQSVDFLLKPPAQSATPKVLARWIRGALGKLKGWPATAQIEAGKLVFAVAGINLDGPSANQGALSEMTLQELHDSLAASLDSARNLMAIESAALQVPDSDTVMVPYQGDAPESEPVDLAPADPESAPAQPSDSST